MEQGFPLRHLQADAFCFGHALPCLAILQTRVRMELL